MLFDDEYAVGDYIKIPALGLEGTVSAITLRNTSLRLSHGEIAMVPHGSIEVVINYTRDHYTLFWIMILQGKRMTRLLRN